MHAHVTHNCPECESHVSVRADVDEFPVPTRSGEVIDGLDVHWLCPHCEYAYHPTITIDSAEASMIPWVGDVNGTDACIQVVPDTGAGAVPLPDHIEEVIS